MFRRQVSGCALAIVLLTMFAVEAAAAEDLVVFDRAGMIEVKATCDLMVIAKLDDRAVALLKSGGFNKLKAADDTARLLEPNTDLSLLWVAASDEETPRLPGMLMRTKSFQLLKLQTEAARAVQKDGYLLSKCMRVDLPADPPFFVPARVPKRLSVLTDIDSLMELVSVDSVESYIQSLQDFQTRYTCTDSFWASGDWVASKFESWGYEDIAFEEFDTTIFCVSRNVIAAKEGEAYPDRFIVVGGHYDAVVYDGGDPNIFAPGADDNGTGTAMAMEIARVLADTPFRKTVRFITFGAEEQGLVGSWVHAITSLYRGDNIELMINADMIGNVDDSYLDFDVRCNEGGYPYGQVLAEIADEYTELIPVVEVGEWGGSDHFPFDQCGFRTVYSAEGDFSPHWHRQTDTIDNIDVDYTTDIIRSNLGMLMLAQLAPVPVSGLEAINAGDGHTVYLDWEPSPDVDVIGYEVYFGTSEGQAVLYDTSYAAADTVYDLQEETGYYFGVTAITADGGRSFIEEFVYLYTRSVPASPETLTVIPDFGSLSVEWTVDQDMDFAYYQVYRKVGDDGQYEQYEQVTGGEVFVDEDLQSNVRYCYQVTQVDTTGLESEPSPEDYSKILSLDSGILLVDEMRDFSGGQGNPTDEEQNLFHQFISEGYPVEFHDYLMDGSLRINDMGPYSTIVWIDDDATSQYLADVAPSLEAYLDIGGNLLFAGYRSLVTYGIRRPLEFEPGDFPFDRLFINEVNCTNSLDFSGATGSGGWPDLEVLPERVIPQWNGLLLGVDVMDLGGTAVPIYHYISASGDTLFDGKPVGISVDDQDYKAVYLTFPLYAMGDVAARNVFIAAMDLFGEQSTGIGDFIGPESAPVAFLSQNYPNPFNNETKIRFQLTSDSEIRLVVYNILGQEVEVLAEGEYPAGIHYVGWQGDGLPSGVYFYRLMLEAGSISRRMTLVR